MRFKQPAILLPATFLIAISVGFVVSDQGAMGQTSRSTESMIEIPGCYVRFYRTAALAVDRPGVIAEMPYDEGHAIEEGDLVVRLRDDVAVANLALAAERASSDAAAQMAEMEAAAAAVELESHLRANANSAGVIPLTTIERLRYVKEAREFAVIRAQDEITLNVRAKEQAEAELKSYRIISKQSGVVTRVYKREGEAVQQGESILEVVDPTVARIEGKLEFSQARRLRVGMPVEVQLDFEDVEDPIEQAQLTAVEQEVFVGQIGFIDVSADFGSQVRIWAEVQNRDGILLNDLPARMRVLVGE